MWNPLQARRREIPVINSATVYKACSLDNISTIQGSAADNAKIMIHLDQALEAGAYKTKMLLQVRDEIVPSTK